jgi:hypothetical protein
MRKLILVQIFIIISCLAQAEGVDTAKTKDVSQENDFLNTQSDWTKQFCYKDGMDTAGNQKTKMGKKKSYDNYDLLVGSALGCDITITAKEDTTEGEDSPNTRRFNFKTDGSLFILNTVVMTDEQVRNHPKYAKLLENGVIENYVFKLIKKENAIKDISMTDEEIRNLPKYTKLQDPAEREKYVFNKVKRENTLKDVIKNYYFYPKTTNQEIFIHKETNEIKIITQNGKTIFFDPNTGLINEEKTKDLIIKQTPLTPGASAITITSPISPLITFPGSQGEATKKIPTTPVMIEHLGKSCILEAKQVFNYQVACTTEKNSKCLCDKSDTEEKKNCSLSSEDFLTVDSNLFNGVTLNTDYDVLNSNIKKKCPDFSETTYKKPTEEIIAPLYLDQVAVVEEAPAMAVDDKKDEEEEVIEVEETAAPNTSEECQKKLLDYFNKEENEEQKNEYMKIQGQISLQRLAWTYLKMTKDNTDDVQVSITNLLKKRNPDLHAKFIAVDPKTTNNQKLNMAMQELRIKSNTYVKTKDDLAYSIHHSDIKMIELLADAEKLSGSSFTGGVMNFTTLIEHGLSELKTPKVDGLKEAKKQIDKLIKKKKNFEKKVAEHLKTVDCTNTSYKRVCKDGREETLDLSQSLDDAKDLIEHIYKDDFGKKKELQDIYQWNNYWLDTK